MDAPVAADAAAIMARVVLDIVMVVRWKERSRHDGGDNRETE
jgi:hypothetical protein